MNQSHFEKLLTDTLAAHGRSPRTQETYTLMLRVFGRLAPRATLASAEVELGTIAARLHREYPESYSPSQGYGISAALLQNELTERARPTLLLLLGTAGFVFLIACANVANLTLARLVRREREMALRTALGAGRSRLLRQLLTEGTCSRRSAAFWG